MAQAGGDKEKAAQLLGISLPRSTASFEGEEG